MTMGVLAVRNPFTVLYDLKSQLSGKPYRSRNLGSKSLELILAAAEAKPKIRRVYLHVQTSNQDAKRFYERHGFKEIGLQENYYKKISPHDAWILEKTLRQSTV
jgi:ribosomal protein S18 acetylase RimI-like enzyme